jgi:putative proteasome-type protease
VTYCLGIKLNDGLVLAADSRITSGIDYVTTSRKLHVFRPAADRIFVLLAAGNLGTTQELLRRMSSGWHDAMLNAFQHLPRFEWEE